MILKFDENVFKINSKTKVLDENDNLICEGIYDFSYKHRRRVFQNNEEIFYTWFKIESDNNQVVICDNKDVLFFEVTDNKSASNGLRLVGDIYNWNFQVLDKNNVEVITSFNPYEVECKIDPIVCIEFIYSFARFKEV